MGDSKQLHRWKVHVSLGDYHESQLSEAPWTACQQLPGRVSFPQEGYWSHSLGGKGFFFILQVLGTSWALCVSFPFWISEVSAFLQEGLSQFWGNSCPAHTDKGMDPKANDSVSHILPYETHLTKSLIILSILSTPPDYSSSECVSNASQAHHPSFRESLGYKVVALKARALAVTESGCNMATLFAPPPQSHSASFVLPLMCLCGSSGVNLDVLAWMAIVFSPDR